MKYSYEILPRPVELGGGWRLRMFEDGKEVGGGVFPIVLDDPQAGVTWWNGCREPERGHWLAVVQSAVPAEAWVAYQLAKAHADAEETAYDWLDSRESV
jgi:hypothetical protein